MARVPRLAPGCDVKSLPLTPAEGYLLSRIDAATDEDDLSSITGFPPEQVAAMLDRLDALGAIEPAGGGASHMRLRATPEPGAAAAGGDDLRAQRRQALARKLSGTHARMTPTIPTRGAAPETEAEAANAQRTAEALNARNDQLAADARHAQLARCLDEGKSALRRKDFDGAVNAYRTAASLAPDDARMQAICNDAVRLAAGALADGHWARAVEEERDQRWEDAALSYARVCAGRPGDALAHERVANAAIRLGNVKRAVEFARKALELAPGTAVFHVTMARAYAAAGLEKSSHGELHRALELAPNDARIQSLVSRVEALTRKAANAR